MGPCAWRFSACRRGNVVRNHKLPLHKGPALPFVLLAAGLTLVAVLGRLEAQGRSQQVWAHAVLVLGDVDLDGEASGEALPIWVREVPEENFPALHTALEELRKTLQGEGVISRLELDRGERVVFLPASGETLASMLASGKLPEPGKPQVLAGDLAGLDSFVMDGVTFRVVGRLQRGVSGLTFAYVLPADEALDEHFSQEAGAMRGWLDPVGLQRLAGKDDGVDTGEEAISGAVRVGGVTRTAPEVSWGTLLGLLLVAVGGAVAQVRLFRWLSRRRCGVFRSGLAEIALRPRLVVFMHLFLYGLFFGFMCAAIRYPVLNARVVGFVSGEFTDGSLSYIGAAYASESIWRAALATFHHNYIVATVSFAILPSLILPFAGVVKNALSFAVAGFAMAPLWTDSADLLVYHAVTLALELEAYIVAAFIVCVLPIRAIKGIAHDRFLAEWSRGLRAIGSGTLLTGVMLAIAAFYEATTLVLLR